jgi:hypothetical protein
LDPINCCLKYGSKTRFGLASLRNLSNMQISRTLQKKPFAGKASKVLTSTSPSQAHAESNLQTYLGKA